MNKGFVFSVSIILLSLSQVSLAADVLPYGTRTKAYSGFSSGVLGDNESVGMAGATVAVPYSISTLESNPAGLTMTMGSVTAQINSNEMEDRTISKGKTRYSQWGLSLTPSDTGYALAYYVPSVEENRYISANTGGETDYAVRLRQFRYSISHLFFKRLSLGASLELAHANRSLGDESHSDAKLTYKLGAMWHVRNHYVLGASFSPGIEVGGAAHSTHPDLPGFDQPIRTPSYLNVGAGWIPNRFFRLGFSFVYIGKTKDTALLSDQNVAVGSEGTLQTRMGASYVIAQYDNLKINTSLGSYYEPSRVQGQPNRLHGTVALDVNPWFINLGIGVDRATKYNNFFVSVGVDVVRTLRTFDIIPKESVPPLDGYLPEPFIVDPVGLPNSVTKGEESEYQQESVSDVKEIIQDIPKNIQNKLQGKPPVKHTKVPTPAPKPIKKSKKKTR